MSQSITEAKYVTIAMNYSNIVWIKKLLEDMQEEVTKHVTLL